MAATKDVLSKARSWYEATPFLKLGGMALRDYQVEAAWSSYINHDTLFVLPTGLGKTMVAVLHVAMVASDMKEDNRYGIFVMLAPTRALLVQHQEVFVDKLVIPPDDIIIVDGGIEPRLRQEYYAGIGIDRPVVLLMTPQTFNNDLEKNRFPRDRLASVIFDEAHHATFDHPYVLIHNDLKKHGYHPRVLGMTASPGETEEEIAALCQALDIDPAHAIFKFREDADVEPYIHPIKLRRLGVDLPETWFDALQCLMQSLAQCCTWLVMAGIAEVDVINGKQFKKAIPKMFFLDLFQKFSGDEQGGPLKFKILSHLATCIKIQHAIEMLETYGIDAILDYHDSLLQDFKKKGTKATAEVLMDQGYNYAIQLVGDIKTKGTSAQCDHPKLVILKQLLSEFLGANPKSRILVFVNYRASIKMICDYMGDGDKVIKIHKFVGQGTRKKSDEGMKRNTQGKILDKFRSGEFNVLVATSVAEEGLDIAECDLVVFYETVASIIKFIQRQGRTGRKHAGNVAILFTRGTMDEFRMKALDGKLSKLRGIYCNVKSVKPGDTNLLDTAEPSRRPALQQRIESFSAHKKDSPDKGEPHVSITDLKRWQDAMPIVIGSDSQLAKDLGSLLKKMQVPVSVVPPSGLPDITIGKRLGIKVLSLTSAAKECLENRIFGIISGLKAAYDHAIIVVWDDGQPLDDELTRDIIVEWLERFGEKDGVKVIITSSVEILATLIKDFHGRVKEINGGAKSPDTHAIA